MKDDLDIEITFDIHDPNFHEYVMGMLKYRKAVYKGDDADIYNMKDPLIPGLKWIITKNKENKNAK